MDRTTRKISIGVAALSGVVSVGVGGWAVTYDGEAYDEHPTPSLVCPTSERAAGFAHSGQPGGDLPDATVGARSPTQLVNDWLASSLPHTRQNAVPANTTVSEVLQDDPPMVQVSIRNADRERIALVVVGQPAAGGWRAGYTYECGTA